MFELDQTSATTDLRLTWIISNDFHQKYFNTNYVADLMVVGIFSLAKSSILWLWARG